MARSLKVLHIPFYICPYPTVLKLTIDSLISSPLEDIVDVQFVRRMPKFKLVFLKETMNMILITSGKVVRA